VKSLYGDTGADHKAEEMAGRLYLAPYVLQDGSIVPRGLGLLPVFIPAGRWKKEHVSLLAGAGWNVLGLPQLGTFLGRLT
jgi:hypothetical protein